MLGSRLLLIVHAVYVIISRVTTEGGVLEAHVPKHWLKTLENIFFIERTLPTFQLSSGWLKASAFDNIDSILVT